jgi:hypothetical protein
MHEDGYLARAASYRLCKVLSLSKQKGSFIRMKIFTAVVLFLISIQASAHQSEIDKFFKLYESGKIIEAVDSIYSTNKWIDRKSDDIHNLKTQLQNLTGLVGEYHGKVKLGTSDIEDRLVHVTYLALYERQPVRLEFLFYRSKDKWAIYSFSFDDDIDDELTTSARRKIAGY